MIMDQDTESDIADLGIYIMVAGICLSLGESLKPGIRFSLACCLFGVTCYIIAWFNKLKREQK